MSLPWRSEAARMLHAGLAHPARALEGLPRGARCRIIVSSTLARYALVPFSAAVVGREANEALARHVFRSTHGERAEGWRIAVAPAPAGDSRVACALDAALLDALAGAARERAVMLSAIQPALAAGFDVVLRRLPASCWVAIAEPACLVLALLVERRWRHLAAERCRPDAAAVLRALAREAILAQDDVASSLPCWIVRFDDEGGASAEPFSAHPGRSA